MGSDSDSNKANDTSYDMFMLKNWENDFILSEICWFL